MRAVISKYSRRLAIGCAAAAAFALPAHATMVTSTNGLTTTYTENFNGGSSFSAGWYNTVLNNDDYMWLSALTPSSSFSFYTDKPLSQLSLSFWYSVPGNNSGQLKFASSGVISLSDTPGNGLEFLVNNPGSSTGGIGNDFDLKYTGSVSNLGAGRYTITLSTAGHLLDELKVDDLVITTTAAVPEPGTLAIMAIGLLGFRGASKRRRKNESA